MINGMYISTMGAMTEATRHGVVANNLANVNTAGFKPDRTRFRELLAESALQPGNREEVNRVLEETGGGVWLNSISPSYEVGPAVQSGNPLTAAILDDNGFFLVERDGEKFLTRDGMFTLNGAGQLVLSDGKTLVLDNAESPIEAGAPGVDGNVEILEDGRIQIANTDQILTQLGLVQSNDLRQMKKLGDNLWSYDPTEITAGGVRVQGGAYEGSAVNPITEMVAMIEASRAYQANMKFVSIQDETLGRTVQDVGLVA